jgi:hypothetical protein
MTEAREGTNGEERHEFGPRLGQDGFQLCRREDGDLAFLPRPLNDREVDQAFGEIPPTLGEMDQVGDRRQVIAPGPASQRFLGDKSAKVAHQP